MNKKALSVPIIVLTIAAAIFTLITAIFLIFSNPSLFPNDTATIDRLSQAAMVVMAKKDLVQKLSLSLNDIQVEKVVEKEWGDASLGCPTEGMVYIQLVTPGYQIILNANGQTYDYRSDLERRVELCAK